MATINLGTDIYREWSFTNRDLDLVTNYGNIQQAVINRLNTDRDFYSIFYLRYGGNLFEHLGDLNHSTIHEYIRIEIEETLKQDPRIKNIECTVNKINAYSVECNLNILLFNNLDEVTLNLVIDANTGISIMSNMEELNG